MKSASSERGAALIAVIWVAISVALLSITFLTSMRQETRATASLSQGAKCRASVEAGLARAMHDLLSPSEEQRIPRFGEPFQFMLKGRSIDVRIWDENGRMNVNLAPENFLADVIESVTGENGTVLAAAIADWRDEDQSPRANGAETSWYVANGKTDHPEDGPLQSVQDLANVRGMTPALHGVLMDLFTVHTTNRTFDARWAPEPLLSAMPGATDSFVREVVEARRDGDPLPPMPAPGWVSEASGPIYRVAVQSGPLLAQWLIWVRPDDAGAPVITPLEALPDFRWVMNR